MHEHSHQINGSSPQLCLPNSSFLGAPIILGATAIRDEDGVSTTTPATSGLKVGYGADVAIPVAGDFMTGYVEYAMLRDNGVESGKGGSVGVKGDFGDLFTTGVNTANLATGLHRAISTATTN